MTHYVPFVAGHHKFAPEFCYRHHARLEWFDKKTEFGAKGLLIRHDYHCADCGQSKSYYVDFDYGDED